MTRSLETFGLAFRLARRELRGGLRGLRVFWLCLTLGVAIIAAVGSVSASVVRGLNADARALLGGDVNVALNHREATAAQRAHLAAGGAVSAVLDTRTMVRTPDNAARQLAELKGVDHAYPLYGALELDPPQPAGQALGQGADGRWGVALDKRLLTALGLAVGDTLHIGEAAYEVRATIVREPDRTGRSLLLGGTALVGWDSLPATNLIKPGSLVRYHYRVRLLPETDVAAWVANLHAAFPTAGWRVRTFDNATPSVERFVRNLTDFLQLVGLTALLVGGVGVGNAVATYLRGKARTIATLKCLGGPQTLVFQMYLLQTLMLAATGVVAGLALGALAPVLFARILGGTLPVPLRMGIYPGPLGLAAAYGFLTTLVFSIWPLARVRDVPAAGMFRSLVVHVPGLPPRRFIVATGLGILALAGLALVSSEQTLNALWFIGGAFATLALFYGAGRGAAAAARAFGRPKRADVRLAITNLYRPGAPTASVVVSLGLGLTVLVAIALVEGNLTRQVNDTLPAQAPNFFFIDIQPDQVEGFERIVHATSATAALERVPMLRGRITAINGVPAEQASVGEGSEWAVRGDRQLTWAATLPTESTIVAGEWWPETYAGPPLISLEQDVAKDFGVGVGDTLTFNILGREITTPIANVRAVNWESMGINFAVVFAPGFFARVPHSHMATVKLDPQDEAALERAILDRFPNISAIRIQELIGAVTDVLRQIGLAVRLVAGVAILTGILVLGGAVATEHRRRVYDAVVLKVLGATRADIMRAYCIEYGLLGLLTAAVAAAVGSGVSYAVMRWVMRADWVALPRTLVLTALGSMLLTLTAGLIGTWRALGQRASATLRNE